MRKIKKNTFLLFNLAISICLFNACNSSSNKKNNYRNVHSAQIYNDSLLVYTTLNDFVTVENIKTNKILFSKKLKDENWSQPILDKYNNLYYSSSDNEFVCVNFKTKVRLWNLKTNNQTREFKFVNDSIIISSIRGLGLIAINSKTGKKLYEIVDSNDNNPCLATTWVYHFVFDKNNFYVNDLNCSSVVAYRSIDGKRVWSFKSDLDGVSKLLKTDKYVFCGITGNPTKNEGKIYLLEVKSGNIVYEKTTPFDLIPSPIFYKNKVVYYTYDSKLSELDLDKKNSKVVCDFKDKAESCGDQIYLLDDYFYWMDCNFHLNRYDLKTYKKQRIGNCPRGLEGVYKFNNQIKFIY